MHVCHILRIEIERLIERRRSKKHTMHVCHIPRIEFERLIERGRLKKHAMHVCHIRCIPVDSFIESRSVIKQFTHVCHIDGIPKSNWSKPSEACIWLLKKEVDGFSQLFVGERAPLVVPCHPLSVHIYHRIVCIGACQKTQ